MPLHPQAQAFLKMQEELSLPDITTDLMKYREASHRESDLAGSNAANVRIEHRYLASPTADLPINIYIPEGDGPFNGLVYFHGGGWVAYDINRYSPQLSAIAASTNSVVIAVNYQKAPEHKFPIPFNDCYEGLQWTVANADRLGIDLTRLGVGGDSAGGNLASAVALAARDRGEIKLAYQWLVYPCNGPEFVDSADVPNADGYGLTQKGMKWLWEMYLSGDEDRTNPYAVPHAATSFSDLPPTVMITAEYDVLREDGISYYNKLKAAGNQVAYKDCPGMIHGFFNYGKYIDEGIAVRDWFAAEIRKIIG